MLNRLLAAILIGIGCGPAWEALAQQQAASPRGGETTIAKQVSADKSSPLLLQADDLIYDNHNNRVIARGNVEIYYNDYVLLANQVIYDRSANALSAIGNVRLKDPDGSVVNAERLTLKDDFRDGFIRSLRAVTQDDARIAAANAYRKDGQTTVYENGVFTTCKPCQEHPERAPIWRVKATRIIADKNEQKIYYENAQFEFFGIPVAWVPYFYMPDPSVKHLSGVLPPSYSHSTSLGYSVAIPLYYSPSPNYDLTLTPEFTTRAGYLLQAEWRQKFVTGGYRVTLDGAYNDNASASAFTDERKWRGSAQSVGEFNINSQWRWGWNVTIESDETFRRFYRLDSIYATERVSQVYLTGQGDRNYFNMTFYRFGNLTSSDVFNFDTDTTSKTITATAYPVLDYNYVHNKPVLGGEFSFDVNAVALTVNNPNTGTGVFRRDTDHVATQAQWRRTITDGIGETFTPFAQARGDVYNVSHFEDVDGITGPNDTFTRQIVVAGLDYSYPFVAHTEDASHVIEPRAQIITRAGAANNDKVPNEDSQSLVFDDTLLFDINKFSGFDRIETGTRTNAGLQYTMQTYNGVSVRVVGGESFQVAGDNPFDPTTGLATARSDYVVGGYFDWRNMFRLVSQLRLNESDFSVSRQDYSFQTKLGAFQGAVSYVAVESQPLLGFNAPRQEIAGFAAYRLTDFWTVFGDARYDLELGQFVRNSVGVQYSDDCYIFSVTYQQTFVQYQDIKPDTTVMVKVGLKYLGQQTVSDSIGSLSPEAAVFK